MLNTSERREFQLQADGNAELAGRLADNSKTTTGDAAQTFALLAIHADLQLLLDQVACYVNANT